MKKKIKRILLPMVLCLSLMAGNMTYVHATEAADETTKSDLDEVNDELNRVDDELDDLENGLDDARDTHSTLEQNKSDAEKYLDSLNSQYKTLAAQLSAVEKDITAKEAEIAAKEADIAAKQADIAAKEAEIAEIESIIETTAQQIAETEENLAEQYEAMKLRIQFMYENSTAGQYLELLLQAESFTDFLNRVEYITAMLEYDGRMRDKYQETEKILADTKVSLENDQARLVSEREALAAERYALEQENASLQARKKELDDLKVSLKKKQSSIASQQADSAKELQEYVDQLASSSDTITSYEEKIAAKKQYYEELLARKKVLEEEEARQKAEEEANNTGGSIAEGDSGIDGSIVYDISDEEFTLLSAIIYCEAGGESYEGQLAVGYVIMNRVRSNKFPDTITGVVYQPNQFSPVGSGRLAVILAMEADPDVKGKVTDSCRRAAAEVLTGTSNVGESLFFRTWKPVPQLVENLEANGIPYYIIGGHVFYHRWVAY